MEREIQVIQWVKVEIDESSFTPEFMQEFRDYHYPFHSLDDHLKHLAQLYARGLADNGDFIEGYGPAESMGIKFRFMDQDEKVTSQ